MTNLVQYEDFSKGDLGPDRRSVESAVEKAGFTFADRWNTMNDSILLAAVGTATSKDDWFRIGLVCGSNRRTVVIAKEQATLPGAIESYPVVYCDAVDFPHSLIEALRDLGGVDSFDKPEQPQALMEWLSEDWFRLKQLSVSQLVTISTWMFRKLGFGVSRPRWAQPDDLLVTDSKTSLRVLIHCHVVASPPRVVDVGDVHALSSRCRASGLDVAALVTNGSFSPAAVRRATSCMPPLYLFDHATLTSVLSESLDKRESELKSLSSIFLRSYSWAVPADIQHFRVATAEEYQWGQTTSIANVKKRDRLSARKKRPLASKVSLGPGELVCVVLASSKDSDEKLGRLQDQIKQLGMEVGEPVRVSKLGSANRIRKLKTDARVWVFSPGFFSESRDRADRLAMEWLAHYYTAGGASKPKIIVVVDAGGSFDFKVRAPVCFARDAEYVDIKAEQDS